MPSQSTSGFPEPGNRSSLLARQIEGRESWLWGFAVTVTGANRRNRIPDFLMITLQLQPDPLLSDLRDWVRGSWHWCCCSIYIKFFSTFSFDDSQELAERDELFQLITENVADMIAVIDAEGRRLYNSPAYERFPGYTALN
jgi:PAS domain-containing protein